MDSARKFSGAQKARAEKRWSGDSHSHSHSHSQTPKAKPKAKRKRKDPTARLPRRPDENLDFESFKAAYPKRSGAQPWARAVKTANVRIKEGATFDAMIYGARRYSAHCDAEGKTGTQYVMQAATFLGPGKHFLEPWNPPPGKSEALEQRNRQHAIDFLERNDK